MRHLGGILGGARLLEIANSRAAATDSEGLMPSILGSFLMAGRFEGIVGRWSMCLRWPRAQVLVCEASISKVPRDGQRPTRSLSGVHMRQPKSCSSVGDMLQVCFPLFCRSSHF